MRHDSDPTDAQVHEVAEGVDLITRLERQVERNRRDSLRAIRRTRLVALFAVLAFLLLAYRTEGNATDIRMGQQASCLSGLAIIAKFNGQQDLLAQIERDQNLSPEFVKRRIAAYEGSRIIPLPVCR